MSELKPDLKLVSPDQEDAKDFAKLWKDPALGDGITDVNLHSIPVDRPKDFFRVVRNPAYLRRGEIYTHKLEGVIDTQHFILGPAMQGRIEEAQPFTLVTCIYRDGSIRLWPLKFPKDGARDNEAWISARAAAKTAMSKWVKLIWLRRAYVTRDALDGYAPDPDLSKLPPLDELVRLGFGEHGVIWDETHPIYRELLGAPKKAPPVSDDDDAGL